MYCVYIEEVGTITVFYRAGNITSIHLGNNHFIEFFFPSSSMGAPILTGKSNCMYLAGAHIRILT